MARYIDTEKLAFDYGGLAFIDPFDFRKTAEYFAKQVREALTADVTEVVRCRDCKKYDSHDHRCKVWNHGVAVTEFCSRGERRREDGEIY